ncbi:hypothetical protein C1I99_31960, partial [Micromonospora deserti]
MAEEDRTRSGNRASRAGRHASHRLGDAPARHRSTAPHPGQTRSALRRLARTRQRRRWAVEGLTVLACLVALVSYLNSPPGADDAPGAAAPSGGVPAGAGRPSGFPGVEGHDPGAAQASPGLQPRQRPPSPT